MKIFEDIIDISGGGPAESIFKNERALLFDIETTGLKKEASQIYMIGCGFVEDGALHIRQTLAQSPAEEKSLVEDFAEFAKGYDTLIHFNGARFDVPYIEYKAFFYSVPFPRLSGIDIYRRVKYAGGLLSLEKYSQRNVERFLGIKRDDAFTGGELIPVYFKYLAGRGEKEESLLLLHNHDDILGLYKIIPALSYADILEGGFEFKSYEEISGTAVMEFTLNNPVPVCVSKDINICKTNAKRKNAGELKPGAIRGESASLRGGFFPLINVTADKALLQFNVPLFEGEAKLAVRDTENYFYLPAEDMIIHKDVGIFVDKSRRKKATKKNAFLKKAGKYIPAVKSLGKDDFVTFALDGTLLPLLEIPENCTDFVHVFRQFAMDILKTL